MHIKTLGNASNERMHGEKNGDSISLKSVGIPNISGICTLVVKCDVNNHICEFHRIIRDVPKRRASLQALRRVYVEIGVVFCGILVLKFIKLLFNVCQLLFQFSDVYIWLRE